MKKRGEGKNLKVFSIILTLLSTFIFGSFLISAVPGGIDNLNITANETANANTAGSIVNISGGYIATINLSTTVQNSHWKAFIGWVNGAFTLDDSSGSTIYDWSLATTNGVVYTTRDSGTIEWTSIACAQTSDMETENTALNHSNLDDNITATFDDTTHSAFYVGAEPISANSCPTLNTYVDNVTQDSTFEEMVLTDATSLIYATIIEDQTSGFDENTYDFQMLVPENGAQGYSGAIAYYMYVEVN